MPRTKQTASKPAPRKNRRTGAAKAHPSGSRRRAVNEPSFGPPPASVDGLPLGAAEILEGLAGVLSVIPSRESAETGLEVGSAVFEERIRPLLDLAKATAPALFAEIAGFARVLLTGTMDVSDALRVEMTRDAAQTARSRFTKFKAYATAGFSEDQAFAMVLAEIKPVDMAAALKQASRDLAKSSGQAAASA